MEQYGEVIGVEGDTASVRFKRSKACGKCRACFTLGSDEAVIEIENILNAKAGDIVEIQLHANSMVKATLMMYGIPLIGLIIGVTAGSFIGGDAAALISGAGLALIAYLVIHIFEPKLSRKDAFKPRMLSILRDNARKELLK